LVAVCNLAWLTQAISAIGYASMVCGHHHTNVCQLITLCHLYCFLWLRVLLAYAGPSRPAMHLSSHPGTRCSRGLPSRWKTCLQASESSSTLAAKQAETPMSPAGKGSAEAVHVATRQTHGALQQKTSLRLADSSCQLTPSMLLLSQPCCVCGVCTSR
jgi:hypothetical protein